MTSGSTNNPKPIVLSQKTKILRSIETRKLYNINSTDVVLGTLPLDTSLGQRLLLLPLLCGGTSVILNTFTTSNFYRMVKEHNITFTILVSSQINELAKDKNKFKKLYIKKGFVSASAKLSDEIKEKLLKKNYNIYEMYGATETGTVTNLCINKEVKNYKSVGRPCNKTRIKILSEKNFFMSKNYVGEILCHTPLKFSRYLGMQKETKESFFKNYFKTGDIGYIDKNNYLYYLGRKKNVLKISGITVYPEDIEKIVIQNKNILETAVLGLTDKNGLEKVILCVVPKNKNCSREKLLDYCYNNLATFQQPSNLIFLQSLPKTTLGKINKPVLKKIISKKL